MKNNIKSPFFVFNPKSYLYGDKLLEYAIYADKLAKSKNLTIFLTCPYADIYRISKKTDRLIITAQHLDPLYPGRGMGKVLPESLYKAGARACFLNHAENPIRYEVLKESVYRAKELGIATIVCANSLEETKAISLLQPDIILCEPTELIGTGKTSDEEYIKDTSSAIKEIAPNTLVMQAAGISKPEDVYAVIKLGADGTGCTSGIIKAKEPKKMLLNMIEAMQSAYNHIVD